MQLTLINHNGQSINNNNNLITIEDIINDEVRTITMLLHCIFFFNHDVAAINKSYTNFSIQIPKKIRPFSHPDRPQVDFKF